MKAMDALKISVEVLPEIENKEYEDVVKYVKIFAEKGKTSYTMSTLPSDNVRKRLQTDGYRFGICSGFPMPPFYTIEWGKKEPTPQKKWYQKLFNLTNGN